MEVVQSQLQAVGLEAVARIQPQAEGAEQSHLLLVAEDEIDLAEVVEIHSWSKIAGRVYCVNLMQPQAIRLSVVPRDGCGS